MIDFRKYKGALVLGDIHGMYNVFLNAYEYAKQNKLYLISLGDIVDYGDKPIECYLLAKTIIENKTLLEWGKIFLNLSKKGLEKRAYKNSNGNNESIFLRSVENILVNNKNKAEVSIEKFKKEKNLEFLYEKG